MKYVLILGVLTLVTVTGSLSTCFGCTTKRDSSNLWKSEKVLRNSLTKLAADNGPYYRLVKINSASFQLLDGTKDIINADLMDQRDNIKNCYIDIFSRSWLKNGIQVTFECGGENKLVKTHSA